MIWREQCSTSCFTNGSSRRGSRMRSRLQHRSHQGLRHGLHLNRESRQLQWWFGQSTVEAAVLLPAFLIVVALLLQPVFIGYGLVVMNVAAHEGLRIQHSSPQHVLDEGSRRAVTRLLGAVPPIDVFHVGGAEGWQIASGSSQGTITVEISHTVRPLPGIGLMIRPLLPSDESGNFVITAKAQQGVVPDWTNDDY